MSTLAILSPSPSSPVPAGGDGAVHAVFTPGSILAIVGNVGAEVRDESGRKVWSNSAPAANNEAWLPIRWPAEPGTYTITATAFGEVMGILAEATQQFAVAAPKLA